MFDPNDPILTQDPQYRAFAGRLVSIKNKIDRINEKAAKEQRDLSDEEEARVADLYTDFEEMEALAQARGEELTSRGRKVLPDPGEPRRVHMPAARGERENHGFRSFGEFLQAARMAAQGQPDNRLQMPRNAASEGSGVDGGFLVPPGFRSEIWESALVESGVLKRVSRVQMPNGSMTIAGRDVLNRSSTVGGVSLSWVGEGEQLTDQTPQMRSVNLKAKKGAIYTVASNELLYDAPSADRQLRATFADALRYGMEEAILVGNGVGRPLGMLKSDALITVAKESSQTADTIVRENTIKMLSRLHPGLVRSAVWVANPTALPQLLELAFKIDNAAGSDFVGGSQEPVLVSAGEYRLHGLPLVFSEALPTLGDLNDLVLVAPSEYILGETLSMSLEISPHARFDYDQTAFRLITRVDGQPMWDEVMTPRNGDTLAPFVTLAERA